MLNLLFGAGMGLKGLLDAARQRSNQQAQAVADAAAIRFSPWSGLDASKLVGKNYASQDPLSGVLSGALSGVSAANNIENAMVDKDLAKAKADYYRSKNYSGSWSPYANVGYDPTAPLGGYANKLEGNFKL